MALSKHAIDTVKATAPAVAPHVQEITSLFYNKMLGRHPELFQFFNKSSQKTQRQPRALADAVLAYAGNIENLDVLGPAVERMAMKHCALQVMPEHYGIVHDNLMEAIGDTLGEAVTPDVAAGWSEAVNALAGILINHEAGLYEAASQRTGGWMGWRKFTIAERNEHNEEVSTFSLKPSDGYDGGFDFTPGMYLTLDCELKDSEGDIVAPRHYTITSAPGDKVLKITVKHLKDGKASSALHSFTDGMEVKCSPPFGDFLNASAGKEAVLLSAGIGVTPMYTLAKHGGLNVKYAMHVDHESGSNPFAAHYVDTPGFHQITTTETGRPDMEALVKTVAEGAGGLADKHVYVCGPTGFMMEAVRSLQTAGAEKILFENFGPRTNEQRD